MWMARDKNGSLYLYKNKPQKNEKQGLWRTDGALNLIKIGCGGFDIPEVQWEDEEPTEVILRAGGLNHDI